MSPSKVQKRKRNPSNFNPKKRRKGRESSKPGREKSQESREKQTSNNREYSAREILKEDKKKGYYIDWEDDPITGESFEPTWEPKGCANKALIADWEKKKAERKSAEKNTPKQRKKRDSTTKKHPRRVDRVVESSSISQDTPSYTPILRELQNNGEQNGHAAGAHLEHSSLKANGLLSPSPAVPPQTPIIQVTQTSGFDPEDYERFSLQQQTQTQIGSSPGKTLETPGTGGSASPQSQAFTLPKKFTSDSVTPDSQSLPGSSSYIPSAQAASGLNPNQTRSLRSDSITKVSHFSWVIKATFAYTPAIIRGRIISNCQLP
jgi:hypothetical protein